MTRPRRGDRRLLRRIATEIRPYWLQIGAISLLNLLATPILLLGPIPLKVAVDSVVGSHPLPKFLDMLLPAFLERSDLRLLAVVGFLQVFLVLLNQLQELGNVALATRTGEQMTLGLRTRLFGHAQRLSLAFHDAKGTADSIYRVQYDAQSIQDVTIYGLIPIATAGVAVAAMIVVTARIDLQLALVALTVVPLLYVLSRRYNERMRPQYRAVKQLDSRALGIVQEVLGGLRVVKAFGQEGGEQARFARHLNQGMRVRVRLAVAEGLFTLLVSLAMATGTAAVLFVGVRDVKSGVLTLGELLMVITYLTQLYSPLKTMSGKVATLQQALAGLERVFELQDQMPDVVERTHARPLKLAAGRVEFQAVSFAYRAQRPVLRRASFTVMPGTVLGIVGKTGVGKTTFVNLLTRFNDPSSGQITLDGTDLRDYKLDDLRRQFGIVLQEPVLFSTTVAENIAYGRPSAPLHEVVVAAKAANAHALITRLPDDYETPVGERGMLLSGGERQRIPIARAFLKDAPLLILDEPTSSVDAATEASIMKALRRLMRGRTTFMIAHRPSTLDHCDEVILVKNGRLVRSSTEVSTYLATGLGHANGETAGAAVANSVRAQESNGQARRSKTPAKRSTTAASTPSPGGGQTRSRRG